MMASSRVWVRAFFSWRAVACFSVVWFACGSNDLNPGQCLSNTDCPAGARCIVEEKRCICVNDEACKEGEFCNRAGVCQPRPGCLDNTECVEGTFCDPVAGRCLSNPALTVRGACGLASQCPFGTVCTNNICVEGCFDDGDCALGMLCADGQCIGGAGMCANDAFCGYRELCDEGQCARDYRGPYCRGCSPATSADPVPCDDPRNFCLINSAETGGHPYFCGVDCSLGQSCPNGYECHRILVLTDDLCTFDAQCKCERDQIRFATRTCTVAAPCVPRRGDGSMDPDATHCTLEGYSDCNAEPNGTASCIVARGQTGGNCTCATSADCADGTACVGGVCCGGTIDDKRECRVGEGRVSGYCNCSTDADCRRDVCDSTRRFCTITGKPCTPGHDDCGPIPCVEGACLIGSNCAPSEGFSCSIVGAGR